MAESERTAAWPLRGALLTLALLSVLVNLLLLVPTVFMLQVFDRVLTSLSIDTLAMLLLGTALGLALLFALDMLRSRLQGLTAGFVGDRFLPAAFARSVAGNGNVGLEDPRDVAAVRQLLASPALLAMFDTPWLLVYVTLIAAINPWLGLTAAVSAMAMLTLAFVNDLATRAGIEKLQSEASAPLRQLEQALRQREAVHAMGMSNAVLERWAQAQMATLPLQATVARRSVSMGALGRTLRQAIQVMMLAVGAYLVITRQATPGIMIAATLLLGRALAPVEQLVSSWRMLVEGWLAWRRIARLPSSLETTAEPMSLPRPVGHLIADHLSLISPGGERKLLQEISLNLSPGESVAIIGPSGSGKTTLARLLLGLQRPSTGVVRIDGTDIASWPRHRLGSWIGYVPQEVDLLPGTVAENIGRMGSVDPQQVIEAAKRARVHELVLSLPQGYDTPVGAGGHPLSPGQRQRIALARALHGGPCLLVLDEPNANLDGAGELALADVLHELRGRSTVVLITHRLGLLSSVDSIVLLEAGKVARAGSREEMLRSLRSKDSADKVAAPITPRHEANGATR
jgi:PrtD family type I secretion system ABC transporter